MRIRAEELEDGVERLVRRAALAADTAIVLATPVDEGRARANWAVSFGSPIISVTDRTDFNVTLSEARSIIQNWRLSNGSIFISNSLPYINRLENGYSKQAPSGMTQFGIAAARSVLRQPRIFQR